MVRRRGGAREEAEAKCEKEKEEEFDLLPPSDPLGPYAGILLVAPQLMEAMAGGAARSSISLRGDRAILKVSRAGKEGQEEEEEDIIEARRITVNHASSGQTIIHGYMGVPGESGGRCQLQLMARARETLVFTNWDKKKTQRGKKRGREGLAAPTAHESDGAHNPSAVILLEGQDSSPPPTLVSEALRQPPPPPQQRLKPSLSERPPSSTFPKGKELFLLFGGAFVDLEYQHHCTDILHFCRPYHIEQGRLYFSVRLGSGGILVPREVPVPFCIKLGSPVESALVLKRDGETVQHSVGDAGTGSGSGSGTGKAAHHHPRRSSLRPGRSSEEITSVRCYGLWLTSHQSVAYVLSTVNGALPRSEVTRASAALERFKVWKERLGVAGNSGVDEATRKLILEFQSVLSSVRKVRDMRMVFQSFAEKREGREGDGKSEPLVMRALDIVVHELEVAVSALRGPSIVLNCQKLQEQMPWTLV